MKLLQSVHGMGVRPARYSLDERLRSPAPRTAARSSPRNKECRSARPRAAHRRRRRASSSARSRLRRQVPAAAAGSRAAWSAPRRSGRARPAAPPPWSYPRRRSWLRQSARNRVHAHAHRGNPSQMRHRCRHGIDQRIHLLDRVRAAQRKADAGARPLRRAARSPSAHATAPRRRSNRPRRSIPQSRADRAQSPAPRLPCHRNKYWSCSACAPTRRPFTPVAGMRSRIAGFQPVAQCGASRRASASSCSPANSAARPAPPRPARFRFPDAARARDARQTEWALSRVPLRT